MMSHSCEYAIQALAELETQKQTINRIDRNNTKITRNIDYSKQLLDSLHSVYNKIRTNLFKKNTNNIENTNNNSVPVDIDADDNSIIQLKKINKIINRELESQNNCLKKIKNNIESNNEKINSNIDTI